MGIPTYCAHCGRITQDVHGGWAKINGLPVCHPNEPGRPDCYREVTVAGRPLGVRRSTPQPAMPWLPLLYLAIGVAIAGAAFVALLISAK
jgi:hypothetical protein